jgi:hypothetical protein
MMGPDETVAVQALADAVDEFIDAYWDPEKPEHVALDKALAAWKRASADRRLRRPALLAEAPDSWRKGFESGVHWMTAGLRPDFLALLKRLDRAEARMRVTTQAISEEKKR